MYDFQNIGEKEGRKEKLRGNNVPQKLNSIKTIRPKRTIITIKSKDSHCDTTDPNLAIYKRHIATVPWSLKILLWCLRDRKRWTALLQTIKKMVRFWPSGHVSNGSALLCLYTEVSTRSLVRKKDREALASPEHTLQSGSFATTLKTI